MLEERRADVLRALVEEFILTGEPVSSRSILEGAGLQVSAATVRNDLAALERDGYVVQPHTSAGRLPTEEAYRFYIDHINPARLNAATQTRIADFFSSVEREISRLLKKTSQLLAEITHYPAVVVGPPPRQETIRAVDLVQLGPKAVLVVTVTGSGHVVQEVCELQFELTEDELTDAEGILKSMIKGRPGDSAEPGRVPDRVRTAAAAAAEAVARAVDSEADVFVGGAPQMASAWKDLQVVQQVLEVLERETELLRLVSAPPGTTIRIGRELPGGEDVDLAVVSTTYEAAGAGGTIGVIGPMRMDYRKTITAVERVGKELGERISS
ncbi:MAG TPA: heat-inducible transcriptional repressor HrcA [Acidimicrobiia bacterium]|jgi:heat-inducible transcriptional repressor